MLLFKTDLFFSVNIDTSCKDIVKTNQLKLYGVKKLMFSRIEIYNLLSN